MTLITDIANNIYESDEDLNILVASHISGEFYCGDDITVEQWRINNYEDLRRWAYPNQTDFNDAQVKINSGINALQLEGQIQLESYVQNCIMIKKRFPK